MIQEELKELLLKDLSARLPYGVKCKDNNINVTGTLSQIGLHYDMCVLDKDDGDSESCYIPNCKPYLFPLSSMNDEQREEQKDLLDNQYHFDANGYVFTLQDFYCKYHIDYRGLIPMGLAIDATGLNIY